MSSATAAEKLVSRLRDANVARLEQEIARLRQWKIAHDIGFRTGYEQTELYDNWSVEAFHTRTPVYSDPMLDQAWVEGLLYGEAHADRTAQSHHQEDMVVELMALGMAASIEELPTTDRILDEREDDPLWLGAIRATIADYRSIRVERGILWDALHAAAAHVPDHQTELRQQIQDALDYGDDETEGESP